MKHKVLTIALSVALTLSTTTAFGAVNTNSNGRNYDINDYINNYFKYYSNQNIFNNNTCPPIPGIDIPGINKPEVDKPEIDKPEIDKPEINNPDDSTGGGPSNDSTVSSSNYEKKVVELVNIERKNNNLPALSLDSSLSNVARAKSKDMISNNYFSHTSPTYGSVGDMLKHFNIKYSAYGENIASGQRTPEAVVKAWMNSAGHKANILSPTFTKIGVGHVSNAKGTPYWTQIFIK